MGVRPTGHQPLSSGSTAKVYRIDLRGGDSVVAKVRSDGDGEDLVLEGAMLEYLAQESQLPVPEVLLKSKRLFCAVFPRSKPGNRAFG